MSSSTSVDASVAGNALIAFGDVEDELRDAAVYPLAYAQLSATQSGSDVKTNPTGYFDSVKDWLDRLGCLASDFDFTAYKPTGATVQLEEVVRELLDKELVPSQRDSAMAALDALKASGGGSSGASAVFGTHSASAKGGGFSISVARPNFASGGDDGVEVSVLAIAFTGTTSPDDFLDTSEPAASLSVEYATNRVVITDELWTRLRDMVLNTFKEYAQGYVVTLS